MFTLLTKPRAKAYFNIFRWILYNKLGKLTYPSMAHYFITYKCNLRCKNCNIWNLGGNELSTKDTIKLLSKLTFLDIIKITGGEPFLKEDIIEIIEYIGKEIDPYILRITTNGTCTEKICDLLSNLEIPSLQLRFSLDGWKKTHDKIRGKAGTFDKLMETLYRVLKIREFKRFKLGINFGVRDNFDGFKKAKKFCKKNKISFIPGVPIKPFIFEDKKKQRIDKTVNKILIENDNSILKQMINDDYNFFEKYILSKFGLKSLMKGFRSDLKNSFKCQELRSLMYILPDGNLVKCGIREEKVDNLVSSDFYPVWFGQDIKGHRNMVDECDGCLQSSIEILSNIYRGSIM